LKWRFDVKNHLRSKLATTFPDPKCRALILSLLTGDIDDRGLALEFNRLGLLHLLGISGFQFSLLAYLLGLALRFFLSYRMAAALSLVILFCYTFVLGDSPPIERAFVSTLLATWALLFGFRFSALNALGVAILWLLLKNPLLIFHLGFQFSFLCTAAILIVYPHFKTYLSHLFAKRALSQTLQLVPLDQHGHIVSFFFREALALNLAIHLVTLPLILYHFHKFPLLSVIYNLFLPALFSLVYLLLILGMVIVFPPLLQLTGKLTAALLTVATHPPALYDFQLRVSLFSQSVAVTLITAILFYFAINKASSSAPGTELAR
jgi:competence protein ComEC